MALCGTLLILTGISWLTATVSVQGPAGPPPQNVCESIRRDVLYYRDRDHGPAMCQIDNAELLYVKIRPQVSYSTTITYICNSAMCTTTSEYQTSSCNTISITTIRQTCTTSTTAMEECNTTTFSPCTTILPQPTTSLPTHMITITTTITPSSSPTTKHFTAGTSVCDGQCTSIITTTTTPSFSPIKNCSIVSTSYGGRRHCTSTIITITITPSSSPTTECMSNTEKLSTPPGTHGGYIAVILVLLAIIITLVVLVGYLVRRTTAQRGTVQITEQPLTDMEASDYLEPVALRQLQTNAGIANNTQEVYSEPADTLNHLHSATDRQDTLVNNDYSLIQPEATSHPPLPNLPNNDYSKLNHPLSAGHDYEVVEEVRREKERTPESS